MTRKFLLIQSRPEKEASDDEYQAFCRFGELQPAELDRLQIHIDRPVAMELDQYSGVLMAGGPANFAYKEDEKSTQQLEMERWLFDFIDRLVGQDKPFLGVCLGVGALVSYAGGRMSFDVGEAVGAVDISLTSAGKQDQLFDGLPSSFQAFVGHKEGISVVPDNIEVLAENTSCIQAIKLRGAQIYATQYHPELDADGLAIRINAYKDLGYFRPEEAQELIDAGYQSSVSTDATRVLKNFVTIYSRKR